MKANGLESCALVERVGDEDIGFIRNFGKSTSQKKGWHAPIPKCIFVISTVLEQQGIHTAQNQTAIINKAVW